MKPKVAFLALMLGTLLICACSGPSVKMGATTGAAFDWLVDPAPFRAQVRVDPNDPSTLHLENGLVRRTLRLSPNAASVDLLNLATGEAVLRAVRPEASIVLDGQAYDIGGLLGQPEQGYLLGSWLPSMTSDPGAYRFRDYETGPITGRFGWMRKRPAEDRPWPPPGIRLVLRFDPPASLTHGPRVSIVYELYDGLPLLAKRLEIENSDAASIRLDTYCAEILAAAEPESSVNTPEAWKPQGLHVESELAFLADSPQTAAKTTFWTRDPSYTSQVNYELKTPCLLEARPPVGPGAVVPPGGRFESFTTFELLFDSTDRERRGLSLRRMYRTIAPWVTENPVLMHLKSVEPGVVKEAVDQCAATGFEMIVLSFGSGLDMESEDPAVLDRLRELADYAHGRGVEIGGYSLLASRRIDDETDVVDPKTGRPGGAAFGHSPCLESAWGHEYFRKLRTFFERTGFDLLEHDGSYPGDVCASTVHPGHRGLADSQWAQWTRITDFYHWCRGRGISLNVPDWYFLSGSNKCAMGYREVNWSLPRDRQVILARQNIFDGTWQKTPSMGWMFVPLVQYQGGGAAATIEPLAEHLDAYEAHLAQNFLAGVQACYRGTRLYDAEATRAVVKKWVDFYKAHRAILDSDIIHVRRPDGRDLDGFLHVNPRLTTKGLAAVFNPTDRTISREWTLPLYYTGLGATARVSEKGGPARTYRLDRSYRISVAVSLPPRSLTWFTIE
ncbi:MAG: alpha-galactosidase [Candidatus Aminicenantales bacterium]